MSLLPIRPRLTRRWVWPAIIVVVAGAAALLEDRKEDREGGREESRPQARPASAPVRLSDEIRMEMRPAPPPPAPTVPAPDTPPVPSMEGG